MNRRILIPVFLLLALMFGACGFNINLNVEQGSGKVITQTREVSNFDRVILNGIGDVTITQGSTEGLEIEAEDNVIPNIKTEVSNRTLTISFDRKTIVPTKSIKFNLAMKDIHSLETRGVSNIKSDAIKTDRLDIGVSGTGSIDLRNLTADSLMVNISGAGNFTGQGQVSSEKVSMSGAGNFDGQELKSATSQITISGLGRVVTWVTDNLDVTISGTGGVDYYGSPKISQQISGLGRLNHAGNK